jgi:hypothetical protein
MTVAPTSGTVGTQTFQNRNILDAALGRAEIPEQMIDGQMTAQAADELYMLCTQLAAKAKPIWTVERIAMPVYDNVGNIVLPVGTFDVPDKSCNWSTPANVSTVATILPASISVGYGQATVATSAVVQWSAAPIALTWQASPDGINWTTLAVLNYVWEVAAGGLGPLGPSNGRTVWYQFDGCPVNTQFLQAFPTVVTQTISASLVYTFGGQTSQSGQTEITVALLNREDWFNLPNKTFNSKALQMWVDRPVGLGNSVTLRVWGVPLGYQYTNYLSIQRQRHIQDVGSVGFMSQVIECEPHWYLYFVEALAYSMCRRRKEANKQRLPEILAARELAETTAWGGERGTGPIRYTPNIRAYTRC